MPARCDSAPFDLIWAHSEWMEHDILEIWDFGKMPGSHCPNPRRTLVLKKSRSWNNSTTSKSQFQPLSWFVDINGKIELEKLVWTLSISAQPPDTFVLLWFKVFKNPLFQPQSQGGKILDFQTPPAPPEKLSRSRPLSTHPGMKYFHKGNPRCWCTLCVFLEEHIPGQHCRK